MTLSLLNFSNFPNQCEMIWVTSLQGHSKHFKTFPFFSGQAVQLDRRKGSSYRHHTTVWCICQESISWAIFRGKIVAVSFGAQRRPDTRCLGRIHVSEAYTCQCPNPAHPSPVRLFFSVHHCLTLSNFNAFKNAVCLQRTPLRLF